jgi:ABC-type lipoprotein export system ATPase subunit
MLDRFRGLITSESFPVSQLSGGEARRFALLRALVAPQPIVILDEPTGELDRLVADRVWDCLFASAEGKLLICATHDTQILDRFDHVLEVTDQEVRLSAGRKLVGRS